MKTFLLSALFLLLTAATLSAQTPTLVWAKSIAGAGADYAGATMVTVDAAGNSYIAGGFGGTVDFDSGPTTTAITAAGDEDAFVCKFSVTGSLLWARSFRSGSGSTALTVAVDASGNVYTYGFFSGSVDVDPGVTAVTLPSQGARDVFISKLDASGNYVWGRAIGNAQADYSKGMGVDASGNVYLSVRFVQTLDCDPGPGTSNLTTTATGGRAVVKLNSAGNLVWAKLAVSNGDGLFSGALVVDAAGNSYLTGAFGEPADFDPGSGTTTLTPTAQDAYLSKLDAAGALVWAKRVGASGMDGGSYIQCDASGNVYASGVFSGTVDFDPGAGTANMTAATLGGFVLKLDAAGGYVWVKPGAPSNNPSNFLAVDGAGAVYEIGSFTGTQDFDPSTGTANLTSTGGIDVFVRKLNAAGAYVWAVGMGGAGVDQGFGAAAGASGHLHVCGSFDGTADFDPGTATTNLTATGDFASFLVKLTGAATASVEGRSEVKPGFVLAPNPASGQTVLYAHGAPLSDATVVLRNATGQVVRTWVGVNGDTFPLDISALPASLYIADVTDATGAVARLRFAKQ